MTLGADRIADNLLIAGALFTLSLAIGQMLVKRRQTANKALTGLYATTFLWVANAIGTDCSIECPT